MSWDTLIFLNIVLGVLGGLLAAAALIIAKKPDAKQYIDKLSAYQAIIGVGLIAVSAINFIRAFGGITAALRGLPLFGASFIAMIATGVLLGALFGMPQIAKWIPGESSAEQKALELSKKVAPYQVILGVIAIVAGLVQLLYMLHILKP
jgi:hypothetical protein